MEGGMCDSIPLNSLNLLIYSGSKSLKSQIPISKSQIISKYLIQMTETFCLEVHN